MNSIIFDWVRSNERISFRLQCDYSAIRVHATFETIKPNTLCVCFCVWSTFEYCLPTEHLFHCKIFRHPPSAFRSTPQCSPNHNFNRLNAHRIQTELYCDSKAAYVAVDMFRWQRHQRESNHLACERVNECAANE